MGRQQYLTRMALGRSAFEDVEEDENVPSLQDQQNPESHDEPRDEASAIYVQKYDDKGRPFNPSIDKFNAELRDAQNEALQLVGVVEKKDRSDRLNEMRQKLARERRANLLAAEHERGELLDFVLTPARFLSRCWVEAFVHRIQIGLYDPARPMADILLSEWRALWTGGFSVSLATRFPAMVDIIAHAFIRIPLTVGAEQITGRLQAMVQKSRLPRKTMLKLHSGISFAFAQRMGLAPPLPLLPPLKFCLSGNPESFHSFGWKPLAGFALIRALTSPASLLLFNKIFHFDEEDDEVPICALFTPFRYPKINAPPRTYNFDLARAFKRAATGNPISRALHHGWQTRMRILHWCGWTLVQDQHVYHARPSGFEDNTTSTTSSSLPSRHPIYYRSTHLAHMPAQHLAQALDKLYSHILVLPFESLMLRTIAATYLSSALTVKTPQALEAASRLYTPFGGGPLAMAFRSPGDMSAWQSLGAYVSRLSIAMALSSSVDALIWFGVYSCTRHVGLTFFDWGRKDQIGGGSSIERGAGPVIAEFDLQGLPLD